MFRLGKSVLFSPSSRITSKTNPVSLSLTLTENARKKLLEIRARDKEPYSLRVTVSPGGCHGFQVGFSLDKVVEVDVKGENTGAEDVYLERESLAPLLVVDRTSLELVSGAQVDYVSELIGSTFQLTKIPNSASGCGCGVSFDLNPSS